MIHDWLKQVWTFRYGAASVNISGTGPATEGVLREHATLTTTAENGIFTAAENVTRAVFRLVATAQPTTATDIGGVLANAFVCFDPPSDAVGDLWLTAADHLTDDGLRFPITLDQPLEIDFPSYLSNYRVKAQYLPAGMTVALIVEGN